MSKSDELLAYARKLSETAGTDVEHGTVVNRAYYAAYTAAKEFHDSLPHPGRCMNAKAGVHEQLIQKLEYPNANLDRTLAHICRYLAAQMRQLKPLREIADYESDQTTTASDAETAIDLASDILDEVRQGLKQLSGLTAKEKKAGD